jgi:hypothetical protein
MSLMISKTKKGRAVCYTSEGELMDTVKSSLDCDAQQHLEHAKLMEKHHTHVGKHCPI